MEAEARAAPAVLRRKSTGDNGTGDNSNDDPPAGVRGGETAAAATRTSPHAVTYVIEWIPRNGRTRKISRHGALEMRERASPLLALPRRFSERRQRVSWSTRLSKPPARAVRAVPHECAFLYLGAGSEHAFTNDDGESYELRVDQIRKVKTGASASGSGTAKASVHRSGVRRFVPPLLADLVSVSSEALGDSDSDKYHR